MLKFSSCLLALILCSSSAFAIRSCDEFPSCEELGYSKSEVANCKEYLSCLWDASYKKCLSIDDTCPIGEKNPTCDTSLFGNAKTQVGSTPSGEACYECKCSASLQTCKWTEANSSILVIGNKSTLSDKCCNGNYKTCTSSCKSVTVPDNAQGTDYCTGCGKSVPTDWECNENYVRTSDSKGCECDSKNGYVETSDGEGCVYKPSLDGSITFDCCKPRWKYACDDGCSDTTTGHNNCRETYELCKAENVSKD